MQYLRSLAHPVEVWSMLQVGIGGRKVVSAIEGSSPASTYCYERLVKTSRSFAMVIQELGEELRDAVCIFYLVLRGLDTVEDDMAFPLETKRRMLVEFHEYLYQPGWTFTGCGQKEDERELLQNFDKIIEVFLSLKEKYQRVISDICKRMGAGMAEFVVKEVDTVEDWNQYCHYVAGLVGIGLSGMFAASGLEDPSFEHADSLSNCMGLALQKTNIIRDYLEDINAAGQSRMFWPKEIWRMYGEKLEDFREPQNINSAVQCMNHLITNALEHIPDCLVYLSSIKDKDNFNFCAIPQVMAIATMAACYNNGDVFRGVVKIRRGEACYIFLNVKKGLPETLQLYHYYASVIESNVPANDPNAKKVLEICGKIKKATITHTPKNSARLSTTGVLLGCAAVAALAMGSVVVLRQRAIAN